MGNEDEITDLVKVSRDKFLPREVSDSQERPPEYSLEDEFARAKKNKNYKFQLVIFLFLLLVVGGTWFLTSNIGKDVLDARLTFNKNEDLNLNELLNSTSAEELRLNEAKSALNDITKEKDLKIQAIQAEYSEKINAIEKRDLGTTDKNELISQAKAEEQQKIEAVESSYEDKITKAQNNVTQKEKAVSEKKDIIKERVSEAQAIINNYKKLQQLKEEKLVNDLTLKYNPYFEENRLQRLLSKYQRTRTPRKLLQYEYQKELIKHNAITEREFNTLRRYTDDYHLLLQRMQRIPYKNSPNRAIDTMQKTSYNAINQYESILLSASREFTRQEQLIQSYQNAFRHLAETSPDIGVVVDARNPRNVLISLKSMARIKAGDKALVFRKSDEYIASLVFEAGKNGGLIARVGDLAPGASIHPFDKIFLQKAPPVAPPKNIDNGETSGQNSTNGKASTPQEDPKSPGEPENKELLNAIPADEPQVEPPPETQPEEQP